MHIRRPLLIALSVCAGALALPSLASAADPQSCYGKVTRIKPTTERDTGATYQFVCSQPIKAFAFATSAQTASFDVAADVFDPKESGGGIRGDDRFGECEGELPGFGFTCTGTYSGFGRVVTATFDTMSDPCARDASRHVILRTSLITEQSDGKLAGFNLGPITGCPKPAKPARSNKKKTVKTSVAGRRS